MDYESSGKAHKCVYVRGPIIIGAGPSGLATAACLSQHGVPFIILERSNCIASLWQNKAYDCLKLHLPKHFCQLPLLKFPPHFPKYPSKHQFISYMESYAKAFNINPKFNQTVTEAMFDKKCSLWKLRTTLEDDEFVYFTKWIVVATGENAEPLIPQISGFEKFQGSVKHTSLYKSGLEYEKQKVLVIGCGNSGMEISLDLCRHNAKPYLVVRNNVHVLPREMFGLSTFGIAMSLLKWLPLRSVDMFLLFVANLILGKTEHYGLHRPKIGPIELKNVTGKTPVLDVGALAQIKSGKIKVMGCVKEITRNGAKFVNGVEEEFDAIILATGYKSNVPTWLKECDYFTEEGMPRKEFPNGWKGQSGLYTVGFSKRGLLGAVTDAFKIAGDIAEDWRTMKDRHYCCNDQTVLKHRNELS